MIKFPKDDKNFSWTRHIKNKMIFYGLSEQKIRTVLNSAKRKEEGIAPNTTAVMKRNDRGKKKEEIWVMYRKLTNNKELMTDDKRQVTDNKQLTTNNNSKSYKFPPKADPPRAEKVVSYKSGAKLLMISAWRYPGISKPGKEIPIPEDILAELDKII